MRRPRTSFHNEKICTIILEIVQKFLYLLMEEKSKQHTQLPNKMALEPKDQLIYLVIRSFMNKDTFSCYPSLQKISEKSGASVPTIRASISRLEEAGYISITRKGRGQEYHFNKLKQFEPFSPEFLDSKLSFTTKSYIVASQQYMFKDVEGLGKISYANATLSKKINMPESTIRKCNLELEHNNYLTLIKNECRDLETGCKTDTKLFDLNKLGQAIIWTLKDHEDRLNDHEDRLIKLEEENRQKNLLIEKLLKENSELKEMNIKECVM